MDVPQFIAGRFRIEREIGVGGMGTVYRASHLGLQRSVAVKIIKSEFAGNPDVADRFMREARTMAKLRHQRAAMIFDAGNLPDGRHFIIMEFIEGVTLAEALTSEGRFSLERAITIALQICEVLEDAHQLGIIHRDLKPSNIMLTERGACVLDFGVAKVLASAVEATNTTHASTGSGQIIGTPRYMSPEQCLGQRVGVRSDLYSLGVVLYEMLAGRPPFTDSLASVLLVKQATAQAPPLPRLRQDVPRSLAMAVHTLLAKRPEDRPQTAAAARVMLQRCLTQPEPISVAEVEPLSSTIAALTMPRNLAFRFGAPMALAAILGGLLLLLAYGGPAAETAATQSSAVLAGGLRNPAPQPTASSEVPPARFLEAVDRNPSAAAVLSLEQARKIAAAHANNAIGEVAVIQTTEGPAIIAIHDEGDPGKTHFFVLRQRGPGYRISDRGVLDVPNFSVRRWHAETIDAGGDGQTQILFTGISRGESQQAPGVRAVLYDPEARQSYSLRVEADPFTGRAKRMHWSGNSSLAEAAYRVALRDKVRALLSEAIRS
jgi:predicted Ser/Thr protein kinase